MQEMRVRSLGQEDSLGKEVATHSSIPAWESHGQRSLAYHSYHSVTKQQQNPKHKKMSREVGGANENWRIRVHYLTPCPLYHRPPPPPHPLPARLPNSPCFTSHLEWLMPMGSVEDIFPPLTSKAEAGTEGIWLRVMFILWGAVTRIFGRGSNSEKASSKRPMTVRSKDLGCVPQYNVYL